jgi:putative membrane protein
MRKIVMLAAATIALSASPLAQSTTHPRPGQDAAPPHGQDAAQPHGTQGEHARKPMDPDHKFVYDTYANGLAEIQLGQLAGQKAASNEVKQFGQRLVTDHSKGNDELKSIASSKSVMLPTAVDAKHKATFDRLSNMSGPGFDRAYMQEMVAAHRNAVKSFQDKSANAKDPEVKAFAAKTLPTLEAHLKQAQSVDTAVGTSGKVDDPTAAPARPGSTSGRSGAPASVPKANTEDDDRPPR